MHDLSTDSRACFHVLYSVLIELQQCTEELCTVEICDCNSKIVKPSWDYYSTPSFASRRGVACVNASATKDDSTNTRWTRYAVPGGKTPSGGWPVYLVFSPWKTTPSKEEFGSVSDPNMTCGAVDPWTPNPKCMNYLHEHCSWDNSNCTRCVKELNKTDHPIWAHCCCPLVHLTCTWIPTSLCAAACCAFSLRL